MTNGSVQKSKRFVCYTATHNDSGLIYIGITSQSLNQRKQGHKDAAKKGRKNLFSEAIRSFGIEAFTWSVVAEGSEDVIRLLEQLLIYEWDTTNPEFGYNEKGGVHPAQIRYQLKKDSWNRFGPPWNQPFPDINEASDAFIELSERLYQIDAIITWIEKSANHQLGGYEDEIRGWGERLKACVDAES